MAEDESTGTSVTFWPDAAIFESTVYDFETLRSRFQQMAFLNKGLKISLTDLREPDLAGDEVAGDDDSTEPKHQSVTYQYMNGIKDYVSYLVKSRKATPVEEDVIDFEAEDLKIGISAEVAISGPPRIPRLCTRSRTRSPPQKAARTKKASVQR
mgnify:FL=1